MKTDDLIHQLASDLRPVRPVTSPHRLTLGLSILSIAVVAIGLLIFHVRGDLFAKVANPFYLADLVIPFVLMVCADLLVGRLSVPGRSDVPTSIKTASFLFASLVIFETVRLFRVNGADATAGLDGAGIKCFALVLVFAVLPAAFLAFITARRAPVRPLMAGLAIAIAGISAGEVAITLHCPIDNIVHIALWHFALPIGVAGAFGTFVISRFLRW